MATSKARKGATGTAKGTTKLITDNRRARFDFELSDHLEAGIALVGTEVKSLREGKLNLTDAYCAIDREGQAWLLEAHISPYSHGTHGNHEPLRRRRLLLNKSEARRFAQRIREKGLTLIPTRVYFRRGWVKVEIALARGKKQHDKRDRIKDRDAQRDAERQLN